jgi:hypothetical protein
VVSRIFCLALLAAGFVRAQDQPDSGAQDQQEPTFEGPSILSRDPSPIANRKGKLLQFRLYGEITGVYDSGLTPVAVDAQGKLVESAAAGGLESRFGFTASRQWSRAKITMEYRGAYREYQNNSLFNGLDQFLNLTYSRLLRQHLTLDLKETLGTTTLANGGFAYLPLTNTDLFAVPANELFDNRTDYLQSRVDLTWQTTARLSFGFGGDGFLVRRASLALAGLNGYSARASVAYRLTRRQTVSASYSHTYFDFQRTFGNSQLETAALGYAIGLSSKWDLSTQAGAIRVQTLGLTQVALDPAIAAIVGQNFAIVTSFRTVYLPIAEARLMGRFRSSSLTFDFSTNVTPGNGVYLTSRQNQGTVAYSYASSRRLTVRWNAGYNQLSTLGQSFGKYTNLEAGGQAIYNLARGVYFDFRYDYRHYTTQNAAFQKDSSRVSLGLAFSPGDSPLAVW